MEDWVAIVITVAFMVLGGIVNAKKEKAKKAERAARAASAEDEFREFEENYEEEGKEEEEEDDSLQEMWRKVLRPENTPEVVHNEERKSEPNIEEDYSFYHHETPETPLPTPITPILATQTVSPLSSIAVVETPELDLKEEKKERKGLKREEMDLRKMIIYSELLKPKFRDF